MIDRSTIDRIYAAANIVEVVSDFVTLKKKGVNYQACCPFHNEKTPSFVVSPTKGLFKCFGCGKGGNAVTFVMEHENLGYVDALKYVAKKYNIEIQERELSPEEVRRNDDRESMMVVTSYAADYFVDALHNTQEGVSVGIGYFRERGFSDATIRKFGLGFCPSPSDAFSRKALASGYKEEFLVGTGLTIKRETGGYYDRFSGRVIFPIHSVSGRVIAFGGRTLRKDKNVAKYLNSPESEIYHKSDVLYGLYHAKKAITQEDYCILVEGYTDVISMHQSGVENVVASSGTSLTEGQIRLISRFTKNVTVIYDGDSAGIKASLRGIDMILRAGLNVRVVLMPDGEDPDSFARSHSASDVKAYIRGHEEDFISFKTRLLLSDAESDPIKRAGLITDIVQSIAEIPDPITRSVYIKECAKTTDTDAQLLTREVARKRMSHHPDKEAGEFIRRYGQRQAAEVAENAAPESPVSLKPCTAGSSGEELERELTKYLLKYGDQDFEYKEGREMVTLNVAEVIISELTSNGIAFRNAAYKAIYDEYAAAYNAGTPISVHHFINLPDPALSSAVVDILTCDDNYVPSKLWKKHDISVDSEADRLSAAVPRAIILYKSKAIEGIIADLQRRLCSEGLDDEQVLALTTQISALNKERMSIAKKLSRLIL
ncbi:MAG: DNA primase [Rikenellaceae bacterium]|nr:DNA primase [Rikenellaceae bacterium]